MLGAALTFRLDPAKSQWTRGSVVAVADATWDVDGISELTYKNVIGYFKRRLRQAHGVLHEHQDEGLALNPVSLNNPQAI